MTKTSKKSHLYDSLNGLWGSALAITFFTTSVFLSWNEFVVLLHNDPIHFIESSILALTTFILFLLYLIATRHEIDLLMEYLGDTPIPRLKPKFYIISLALGVLFSSLFASSRNIFIYSSIFAFYNLFDFWGNHEVLKNIRKPIEIKLIQNKNSNSNGPINQFWNFYFERPILPRIVTMLFINAFAVCLGLTFSLTGKAMFRNTAYVVLISNIILSEIVIHYWRWQSIYKI